MICAPSEKENRGTVQGRINKQEVQIILQIKVLSIKRGRDHSDLYSPRQHAKRDQRSGF